MGAVQFDDLQHVGLVGVVGGVVDPCAACVAVTREGPEDPRHLGALLVGMPGHDGGDRPGQGPAFLAVVAVAVGHDQRAEVGIAEAEGAEDVRVLGDRLDRVAGVVDQDLLGRDEQAHGGLEAPDIETAVIPLEAHQVERGQVAGGVVQEQVFRARVGRVLAAGALAGVPLVDGGVELHAGVAADPGALGDLAQQGAGILLLAGLVVGDAARPPLAALEGGVHELVAGAHGQVLVLVHDRGVGLAVVAAVVALVDQGPGLPLLEGLGLDEFLDVGMPVLERVHLGRAARLAARLDHVGHLVVHPQERKRAAGLAAAREFLARAAQRREVAAGAAAVLEQHRLRGRQAHDVLHRVLDALDETGAGLRVLVLGRGPAGATLLAVVEVIALALAVADAVLLVQADVEPDRRVEGAVLVQAEPGQVVVEVLGVLGRREVAVGDAPVGDGARDPVDQLAHRRLAPAFLRVGAVGDVAVEVLRDRDLGRQFAPLGRHFDVLLFEDGLAAVIGDGGGAVVPFHLVEGGDPRGGEGGGERKPGRGGFRRRCAAFRRGFWHGERRSHEGRFWLEIKGNRGGK